MSFKILTPKIHGALDYAAATALIALPFVLNLTGLPFWLSVIGGAGLIGYSLITDYAFSITGALPFRVHLTLDLIAAVAFAVAPFLFGWSGVTMGYYLVMAAGVLMVVALSATENAQRIALSGSTPSELS